MSVAVRSYLSIVACLIFSVSCSVEDSRLRYDTDHSTIRSYTEFLEWLKQSPLKSRVNLKGVAILLWPGEQIVVFDGKGLIYDRCYYIHLDQQQVRRLRSMKTSEDGIEVDALVETGEDVSPGNLCAPGLRRIVRVVSFKPR